MRIVCWSRGFRTLICIECLSGYEGAAVLGKGDAIPRVKHDTDFATRNRARSCWRKAVT